MSDRVSKHEPISDEDRPRLEKNVALSFRDRFRMDPLAQEDSVAAVIIPDIRYFWAYYDAFGSQDRDKVVHEARKVLVATRASFPKFRYHGMLAWDKFLCTYLGEADELEEISQHIITEFQSKKIEPESPNALRALLSITHGGQGKQMTFGQRSYEVMQTGLVGIAQGEKTYIHPAQCQMKVGVAYNVEPYSQIPHKQVNQKVSNMIATVMQFTLLKLKKKLNGHDPSHKLPRYSIDGLKGI